MGEKPFDFEEDDELRRKTRRTTRTKFQTYCEVNKPSLTKHAMYCKHDVLERNRIATTRLRLSSHNLAIERGRCLLANGSSGVYFTINALNLPVVGPAVLDFTLSLNHSGLIQELRALTGKFFIYKDVGVFEISPILHNTVPDAEGGKVNDDSAWLTSFPLTDTMEKVNVLFFNGRLNLRGIINHTKEALEGVLIVPIRNPNSQRTPPLVLLHVINSSLQVVDDRFIFASIQISGQPAPT
ncbi:hypothetical protein CAPTEDRAFT_186409 [Capitella teleta]|uniref:Uncharacterized protein n=1 Tax=Capitella teleta TaxID=283909 RepID=R7U319_CAPTE|nr:hypothetical protein CAPTEDRAFT_186409 [Capitella teleta]|eukprot:ELU00486.1 hypothetical protein CAPTEDRAFT_186409 [Capitella teleta]